VNIEKMRVGKVSPLRNLLSVLSLNEPTDYTFDRMLIDSYLRQDMLLIRKLDMSDKRRVYRIGNDGPFRRPGAPDVDGSGAAVGGC
jgi:hypothetical protein